MYNILTVDHTVLELSYTLHLIILYIYEYLAPSPFINADSKQKREGIISLLY